MIFNAILKIYIFGFGKKGKEHKMLTIFTILAIFAGIWTALADIHWSLKIVFFIVIAVAWFCGLAYTAVRISDKEEKEKEAIRQRQLNMQ